VRRLAARVRDIEVIIVNNETESLVLENNLIKRYRPAYNVMLVRQSSGYAYILLTGERVPRFVMYRKNRFNKSLDNIEQVIAPRRFGPFVSRRFRDALLDFVNEYFGLRVCKPMPNRVCLRYHLGRCSGICEGLVSAEDYADAVREAVALLSYHSDDLIAELKERMLAHADRLEFEKAQKLRDQIRALEATLEKQIVDRDVDHDQDVVVFGTSKVMVAHVEAGAVREAGLFDLDASTDYAQACRSFLITHYGTRESRGGGPEDSCIPAELIVNQLDDVPMVTQSLAQACGRRIKITLPKRGAKRDLLKLCEQNYRYRTST
jgi:excinuclease ABC subunit C